MIIYRYEYPNGDGPFFTKDGVNHVYPDIKFNDDTLSGCESIEKLNKWFTDHKINTDNLIIRKYVGDLIGITRFNGVLIVKSTAQRIDF